VQLYFVRKFNSHQLVSLHFYWLANASTSFDLDCWPSLWSVLAHVQLVSAYMFKIPHMIKIVVVMIHFYSS